MRWFDGPASEIFCSKVRMVATTCFVRMFCILRLPSAILSCRVADMGAAGASPWLEGATGGKDYMDLVVGAPVLVGSSGTVDVSRIASLGIRGRWWAAITEELSIGKATAQRAFCACPKTPPPQCGIPRPARKRRGRIVSANGLERRAG